MRYLPDTNVWIQHLKQVTSLVSARLMRTPAAAIAVCSIVWAEIRDTLERRGEIIGPYDLQIAAIALVHDLTVVTNNDEFRRVDGLRVEDWSVV
jgi:tRNA(fMet)-specific endonuclease VapC